MENPYEEAQTVLLNRIIGQVDKLNEAFLEAIRSLSEVNEHNKQISEITDMWANYNRNVRWNLSSQGELGEPK